MSQKLCWRNRVDPSFTYLNIEAKASDTKLGTEEESEQEGKT